MTPQPPADDDRTVMPGAGQTSAPARPAPVEHYNARATGTRIGECEIDGLIGVGGFGIVYLAHDHSLDRKVALKEYMPSELAQREPGSTAVAVKSQRHADTFDAGMRSFINEARLLAQFDHPSLVKVYRFWEQNGTAYMVMPFYEGATLKARLSALGGAPEEDWLKALLSQLLDALEIIHGRQCYHRDIAPDNILILPDETPLLLDFGAARRVIGDMTQALTVILKPGYAPIEQYAEAPNMRQGPWTDIYALASVAYFAIVGKPPVPAVARVMSDPLAPLAQVAAGRYSEDFLRAIDSALAVRPEDRPQDIAAFRQALGFHAPEPVTRFLQPRTDAPATLYAPVSATPDFSAPTHTAASGAIAPATTGAPARPGPAAPEPRRSGAYRLIAITLSVVLLAGAVYFFYEIPLPAERPAEQALTEEAVHPALGEIQRKLAAFDCALLQASMNGTTAIVSGHVGGEADLKRIDTEVGAIKGVQEVEYAAVRVFPRPYCSVVSALSPHTRHTPQSGTPGIALKGGAREAFEGEMLVVEVTAPKFDAYVYADLYDSEANVVHLLPNAGQTGRKLQAGERLVLGDDPLAATQWEVVPPFGKHLLVVMASDTPLFDRERPQVEDVFGYLRAVRDSAAAKPSDAPFVVYYEMVDFLPRRQ